MQKCVSDYIGTYLNGQEEKQTDNMRNVNLSNIIIFNIHSLKLSNWPFTGIYPQGHIQTHIYTHKIATYRLNRQRG